MPFFFFCQALLKNQRSSYTSSPALPFTLFSSQALLEKYGKNRFKVGEDDDGYPVKMRLKYFFLVRQHHPAAAHGAALWVILHPAAAPGAALWVFCCTRSLADFRDRVRVRLPSPTPTHNPTPNPKPTALAAL